MPQLLVETRGLRVDYGPFTAVWDLDLSIEAGTIYGLIGPNGAGKTTTIRVLSTLLEPTYGEVRIDGIDAQERPEEAHAVIGYMPDNCPLYDDLLVDELLQVYAAAYRLDPHRRGTLIDEVLALVNLDAKRRAFVGTLSRGMRQRLVLAKTLLHDPKLLLLDEPASGLDPMARIELRDVLRQLGRAGKAILVSSHILTELADFCNAVGIMEKGRMVVSGRTEEIGAKMSRGYTVAIEFLPGQEGAARMFEKRPGVRHWALAGEKAEVILDGGAEAAAELLRDLVVGGFKVRNFAEKKMDLEEIFMKVGAREVS
jgi:ABC-2 type transport system ATP-binding protein